MTILELSKLCNFEILTQCDTSKNVTGVYCCDLLSVAMSEAFDQSAWVTVMGNINSIAVASLTGISCIIFTKDANVDDSVIKKATEKDICVLRSTLNTFDTALEAHKAINND